MEANVLNDVRDQSSIVEIGLRDLGVDVLRLYIGQDSRYYLFRRNNTKKWNFTIKIIDYNLLSVLVNLNLTSDELTNV